MFKNLVHILTTLLWVYTLFLGIEIAILYFLKPTYYKENKEELKTIFKMSYLVAIFYSMTTEAIV